MHIYLLYIDRYKLDWFKFYTIRRKSIPNIFFLQHIYDYIIVNNYCNDDSNGNESANCGVSDRCFFLFLEEKRLNETGLCEQMTVSNNKEHRNNFKNNGCTHSV